VALEKFVARIDKIFYLAEEVEFLKGRIQKHGTGHIITAINVLEQRIEELKQELRNLEQEHIWEVLKNERS